MTSSPGERRDGWRTSAWPLERVNGPRMLFAIVDYGACRGSAPGACVAGGVKCTWNNIHQTQVPAGLPMQNTRVANVTVALLRQAPAVFGAI